MTLTHYSTRFSRHAYENDNDGYEEDMRPIVVCGFSLFLRWVLMAGRSRRLRTSTCGKTSMPPIQLPIGYEQHYSSQSASTMYWYVSVSYRVSITTKFFTPWSFLDSFNT